MKAWLWERRLKLLLVGAGVPALMAVVFWSTIRSQLLFSLACYCVGLPTGILVIWARQRGRDFWSRLEGRQRMLLRFLALFAMWCLLAVLERDLVVASWTTAAVALFWCSYALFSHVVDSVWSRMRGR